MMTKRSLVVVVDDDESVRESLPDLLGELGFAVHTFPSGEEFLASDFIAHASYRVTGNAVAIPQSLPPTPG